MRIRDAPQSIVIGSGATTGDLVVLSGRRFKVRAERSGTRNGRVCTVEYESTNPAGVRSSATCKVGIPHDQPGRSRASGPHRRHRSVGERLPASVGRR